MKKFLSLLTLALLGAATPVFADFNFEILWQKYDHNVYEGYDGMYYTIKATASPGETGKIYLADIFNAPRTSTQSEVLNNNEIVWGDDINTPKVRVKVTDFGYTFARQGMSGVTSFTMTSASDSISELQPGDVVKLDSENPLMHSIRNYGEPGVAVRNGYYLGEFKDGDEIQVYLRAVQVDDKGNEIENSAMAVTSNNPDGQYNSKFNTRWDQVDLALANNDVSKTKLQIAQLYLQGQLPFVILGVKDNGEYVYGSSKEVDWVPQGSPLPGGVQIALIAGLFGLGFWYVRRRKAVTA